MYLLLPKYTLDPGHVNLYFYNLREPYIYKPYGFLLFRALSPHFICVFFVFSSLLIFSGLKKKNNKTKQNKCGKKKRMGQKNFVTTCQPELSNSSVKK